MSKMLAAALGVCIGHYDYKNALQGRAVPNWWIY